MESFHIKANWVPANQQMLVSLNIKGQTYIELFTRKQWQQFIARLDVDPLRIGGVTMALRGDPKRGAELVANIRDYLRRVDAAFRQSGRTDTIPFNG